jgi:peptide-methionine (S)-S-oxide reductase
MIIFNKNFRGDHTEAIEIHFDPSTITYERLLNLFWNNHEYGLTTKIKKQYASIIFYHNEEQKKIAEQSRIDEQKIRSKETIITEIVPAGIFYPAEE